MNDLSYAYIGHWSFSSKALGITRCLVRGDGSLQTMETVAPEVRAGYIYLDQEKRLLYVLDETDHQRGEIGGGGSLRVYRISAEDGTLHLLQERPTLAVNPAYLCIDPTRSYLLVAHHTLRAHVTQIAQGPDGSYCSQTKFDDAALVLFPLRADGTTGSAVDVSLHHGDGRPGVHPMAHLHCIQADPTGRLYTVTDKGTDKIYTYRLNAAQGRLEYLSEFAVEDGCAPRYCLFHPKFPLLYVNNERRPTLNVFRYGAENGRLERLAEVPLLPQQPEAPGVEPSDLRISRNGRWLYAAVRGVDQVSALEIGADGLPVLRQTLPYGGSNCRGLCLAPDDSALYAANMESGDVTRMAIDSEGKLLPAETVLSIDSPANLCFWDPDQADRP